MEWERFRCGDLGLRIKLLAEHSMSSVQSNLDVVFGNGEALGMSMANY